MPHRENAKRHAKQAGIDRLINEIYFACIGLKFHSGPALPLKQRIKSGTLLMRNCFSDCD